MDEATVRDQALQHAQATVAKDFRAAGSVLSESARGQAGNVMKAMPDPLTDCEVTSVDRDGDAYVAQIRYYGEGGETIVESRWEETEGRPTIVNLEVL